MGTRGVQLRPANQAIRQSRSSHIKKSGSRTRESQSKPVSRRVEYLFTSVLDGYSRDSPRSGHTRRPRASLHTRRTSRKKAYTAKLKKLPDFSTLGYIYSDWAKDGFDGKQLTVTTYI